MTPKKLIFLILAIVIIAGVAGTLALTQKSKRVYQVKSFPESVAAVDPPSTLAGILIAAEKGDGEKLLASLTPRMQEKLQRQFGKQIEQQGITMAALAAQMGKHWSSGAGSFKIVNQQTMADARVKLDVQLQGRNKPQIFTLKKIEGAWMIDDFRND